MLKLFQENFTLTTLLHPQGFLEKPDPWFICRSVLKLFDLLPKLHSIPRNIWLSMQEKIILLPCIVDAYPKIENSLSQKRCTVHPKVVSIYLKIFPNCDSNGSKRWRGMLFLELNSIVVLDSILYQYELIKIAKLVTILNLDTTASNLIKLAFLKMLKIKSWQNFFKKRVYYIPINLTVLNNPRAFFLRCIR